MQACDEDIKVNVARSWPRPGYRASRPNGALTPVKYDGYDRSGPRVFVGEYAAQSVGVASPDNHNSWRCALYASAILDQATREVIIKAVNITDTSWGVGIYLQRAAQVGPEAKVTLLTSPSLADENSLEAPKAIYPQNASAAVTAAHFDYTFKPYSLTVLRVPIR